MPVGATNIDSMQDSPGLPGVGPVYVGDVNRAEFRKIGVVVWVTMLLIVSNGAPAYAAVPESRPASTFFDDDGNVHEGAIEAIAGADITVGCDDLGEFFCPDAEVTRAQMATFLTRAFGLTPRPPVRFTDAAGVHAESVGAVEEAGWVTGCNPPSNDRF